MGAHDCSKTADVASTGLLDLPLLFIVALSQCSLAMYLMDSYSINNGTESQHAIVYAGESIVWVLLAGISVGLYRQRIERMEFDLLLIGVALFLMGLLVGQGPLESMRVLAQTITYFRVMVYLAERSLADNIRMLRILLYVSIAVFIGFDVFNQVRSGNTLLQLGIIQIPLWLFGILVVLFDRRGNRWLVALFLSFLGLLYLDVLAGAGDPELVRLQYLPLGLSALIALGYLLGFVLRSTAGRLVISAVLGALLIIYFDEISTVFVFESRLGSYTERIYLLATMWRESSYFLVPQGYGASFHLYDLGIYNLNFGYRVLYPPHSGIAVLLYEYSALGLAVSCYFAWRVIRSRLVASVAERRADPAPTVPRPEVNRSAKHNVGYNTSLRTCDPKLARHLLTILGCFWLSHNLFYLKGVITADNFSDDGLLVYAMIGFVLYRLIIAHRSQPIADPTSASST